MAYLTDPLYTKFSVDVSITNKSILGKNYCIEEAPKIPLILDPERIETISFLRLLFISLYGLQWNG